VVVEPADDQDVQSDAGGHGEAPHEVQVEGVGAVDLGIGAVHEIQRDLDHGIVHDDRGGGHPLDGPAVHGLDHGLADGDGRILDEVVVVVPSRLHGDVERGVPRQSLYHVLKELDVALDVELARAVDAQLHGDIGLARLALHLCGPACHSTRTRVRAYYHFAVSMVGPQDICHLVQVA
jgi:hypothetical protein